MADKKITALTDLGDALAAGDLFHVVDDPSGTPINKKVTAANVFNNIPTFISFKDTAQTVTGDGSTSTAITLDAPGDSVVLMYKSSFWYIIGGDDYAVA